MRAALALSALAILAGPAAAAPRGPHGPACALTTAECLVVAREMAAEHVLQDEDERTFGAGMSPFDKTLALLDRHYARMDARLRMLPPVIANEWVRLYTCRTKDDAARRDGTANDDPKCR